MWHLSHNSLCRDFFILNCRHHRLPVKWLWQSQGSQGPVHLQDCPHAQPWWSHQWNVSSPVFAIVDKLFYLYNLVFCAWCVKLWTLVITGIASAAAIVVVWLLPIFIFCPYLKGFGQTVFFVNKLLHKINNNWVFKNYENLPWYCYMDLDSSEWLKHKFCFCKFWNIVSWKKFRRVFYLECLMSW